MTEKTAPDETASVAAVTDWLLRQALGTPDFAQLFESCCQRLAQAGMPIMRGHIAFRTLHPLYDSAFATWSRDAELDAQFAPHSPTPGQAWLQSPLYHMIEAGIFHLRRPLQGGGAVLDFPLLSELRDAGATEYIGFIVPFAAAEKDGVIGSWTTDRPGGFTEEEVAALENVQNHLAVACQVLISRETTRNILNAYLGRDAGREVLNGTIKRGDGRKQRAALWYSDLRNSTGLADELGVERFLGRLNDYFECTAGAVLAQGGEVLSLVGDAVLAVFPIGETPGAEQQACEAAMRAATQARAILTAKNAQRPDDAKPMAFGIGLHVGSIIVGNVGLPDRLAFTAVGAAVNEVARVENLTKTLGRPVLATEAFARALPHRCESLGMQRLRGVSEPHEIFAPHLKAPDDMATIIAPRRGGRIP